MDFTVYGLCLTEKESYDPLKLGYGFIKANEDRLVQFGTCSYDAVIHGAYDVARSYYVVDGIVYCIHKDYMDVDAGRIVFMLKPSVQGADTIDFDTSSGS